MSFRRCSTDRKDIQFGAKYWVCSVSTCNRARLALYFCSPACWDAHLSEARHREAWAEERVAPTEMEWAASGGDDAPEAPARRIVVTQAAPTPTPSGDIPRDVLVVVSKLKAYVKARSGMNTSDNAVDVISEHLRKLCDEAVRHAAADGRKTVMDRDFLPFMMK